MVSVTSTAPESPTPSVEDDDFDTNEVAPSLTDFDSRHSSDVAIPKANGNDVVKKRIGRLSTVSRMYDVDGDGVLDEAEQQMRNMDKSGRGHLSNETVYKMMQEQLKTQKQLCKCISYNMCAFLFVHMIYDM